jgi:UDP-glucuronate 4-epimerase
MKYVVTGGAGFIGSNLCEALLELPDSKVYNIDNFNEFYPKKNKMANVIASCGFHRDEARIILKQFQMVEQDLSILKGIVDSSRYVLMPSDIRYLDDLPDADILIHLAGYGGVRPSIEDPMLYEENNIKGTLNLIELCRKKGIKKFIFASSSSVYGNSPVSFAFKESDKTLPISPYAFTKISMEMIAHVYHKIYGIDIIGLRFFTVYGKRQRPDLAIYKFTDNIYRGIEIPFYGNGDTERDYTYIDDTVMGIIKATEYIQVYTDIYEILNLGRSDTITLDRMVKTIEDALGMKAKRKYLPVPKGDVRITFADMDKTEKILGYKPRTGFEDGIKKFVGWYLDKEKI